MPLDFESMDMWFLVFLFIKFTLWETVNSEVQSFEIQPTDTQVLEGQTAILNCKVANERGKVQWSKDQVLLGYDRSIPGYPRHAMETAEQGSGVHHLIINNVTADDAGDYECQVGPVDGHPALSAKAHLTIFFVPTSIEIKDHENGTKVKIKQSEKFELVCEVKGGKPAPEIRWYKNSNKLRADSDEISTTTNSGNGDKEKVSSTLKLNPLPDDNGAVYACESQPLVFEGKVLSSEKLKTSVQLDVQFPPGRPMIGGYQDGQIIRVGDMLKLRCISRGGNPLAQVVWLKNGEVVDHSYITTDWEAINELSHTVDSSDNGARYTCKAESVVSEEAYETSISLTVLYAPAKVTIDAPDKAKSGDVLSLACKTAISNPASEVSWVVDGRPIISPNVVTEQEKGGWITKSQINVNVTEQDRNMKLVSCYAINQALGETVVSTATISILYAPDPPAIFGYSEGASIRAENLQRLTCVSQGGNPLPTLKWFKEDKEVDRLTTFSSGNIVSAQIAVIAADNDNGAKYRCESSSPAISEPLTAVVKLTVYFPPSSVKIKIKPKKPKAGHTVSLTCESTSSNPPSIITWWKEDNELKNSSGSTSTGSHGGTITKSNLTLPLTYEDDGATYICKATNAAVQQSVHDAVTLRLLYKPVFPLADPVTKEIREEEFFSIDMQAKANPAEIVYIWMKDNATVQEGPSMNFSAVSRADAGQYVCQATNDIGYSQITLYLKVLYPATVLKPENASEAIFVIAEKDSDPEIQCTAEGYPLPEDVITWKRDSFDMAERTKTSTALANEKRTSKITVLKVKKEDTGEFICKANNGIGSPDELKIALLVKHSPYVIKADGNGVVKSNRNVETKIRCRAGGVPEIRFTWSLEGAQVTENDRISSSKDRIDHVSWESTLTIKDVNAKDFGDYNCIARNDVGFATTKVALEADSAPDPPAAIRVVNGTREALHLVWVPGFDGGHESSYRIRFRALNSPSAKYIDVYPTNSTMTWLTGLKSNVTYDIAIMAFNEAGSSSYTTDIVKASTVGKIKSSIASERPTSKEPTIIDQDLIRLLATSGAVVFVFLIFLNMFLLYCYYRRKRSSKYASDSQTSHTSDASSVSSFTIKSSEEITLSEFSEDKTTVTETSTSLTRSERTTSRTSVYSSESLQIALNGNSFEDNEALPNVRTRNQQFGFYEPYYATKSFI